MKKGAAQIYDSIRERERESKTCPDLFAIPADKTLSLSCRRIMILGAQLGAPSVFIRP